MAGLLRALVAPRFLVFSAIAAFSLGVDQLTKVLALVWLPDGHAAVLIPANVVLPELALVREHNTGAAFSFLAGVPGAMGLFYVALVVVIGVVIRSVIRMDPVRWVKLVGLGLVLGGALGNGFDRVFFGAVTDFIRVSLAQPWLGPRLEAWLGDDLWPIFNVADVVLAVGVILLVAQYLVRDAARVAEQEGA